MNEDLKKMETYQKIPMLANFLSMGETEKKTAVQADWSFHWAVTLGPWPVWYQVLGHPSSVRYGFHLMGWGLSRTRYWLVTLTTLCRDCTCMSHRQDSIVDQMVCNWVGVYGSLVACKLSFCIKDARTQGKSSVQPPT